MKTTKETNKDEICQYGERRKEGITIKIIVKRNNHNPKKSLIRLKQVLIKAHKIKSN